MVRLDTFRCLLKPETKVAIYLTKNTCVDYYIDSTSRATEARNLKPTRPSGLGYIAISNKISDMFDRK